MRILILIILIHVSLFISGQSHKSDKLKERLEEQKKEDTTKVNLLNQLAYELQKNDPKLSSEYADKAFQLSGKLKYDQGKAYSLWIKGLLSNKTDKKQALDYFEQADKIAEVIKDNYNRSLYLTAIGNLKTTMGNSQEGILFHKKALNLAESVNNKNQSAKCRINISMHNASQGNILEAVTELQKVICDSVEINDSSLLAKTYSNLATLNARSNNFVKGMEYYLKALDINEKINDKNACILCLINIASLQAEHKDRTTALKTVNKGLNLSKEQNNAAYMGLCYAVLGNLHVLSDKKTALKYYHSALSFNGMSASQRAAIYMRMGVIHTSWNEFDHAEMYFQKALKIAEDNKYKLQLSGIYRRYSEYFLAKKTIKLQLNTLKEP
ncbi:MAG: tetratricopeptide repeat protein [Bacteroidales bacterium]